MSYVDPEIPLLETPVGLDSVIQSLQVDLAALPWLEHSFGRAWAMEEGRDTVPKCYNKAGEYHNVLPNDHFQSQSFIAVKGEESWEEFSVAAANHKSRKLKIIFWFNLKTINPAKDYIFTEELKTDVERIIKDSAHVQSIDAYVDEKAGDVFEGYALPEESKYLMYPYSGFRFDITVGYLEHTNC